jgi:hypothetical protein
VVIDLRYDNSAGGQKARPDTGLIGAVMRKLVHLIYGVPKSGKPFDVTLAMPRLDFQDGN